MEIGRREFLFESLAVPVASEGVEREIRNAVTGRGKALLVGMSEYEAQSGWLRLPGVTRNIDMLAQYLRPHFASLVVRKDVRLRNLSTVLDEFFLANTVRANDRLFFFYAGHGFYNMLEDQRNGYITAVDTRSPVEHAHAYRTALPMSEINVLVGRSKAKHIFCVFDSCYSGSIVTPSLPSLHQVPKDRRFATKSRIFLSSGGYSERVPEPSPVPSLLLEGLAGAADRDGDGLISAYELGAYVNYRVNQLYSSSATPFAPRFGRLQGSDTGDFFFASRLSQRPPPVSTGAILRVPFELPDNNATPRTYLLFFDWDRALMTIRAHEVAWEASMNALDLLGQDKLRRLEVRAHSDAGVEAVYAQRLTALRADIVNLAIQGFELPREVISARGFGSSVPLVPNADGVREPQNRRVEIIINA